MDWSNKLVLEFLELYEIEEIIWNPKNINHKSKSLVLQAWENIRNGLSKNLSVADLKRKKECLMATYRNLQNKVHQSKGFGEDIYKPSWFCYDRMHSFLQHIYKPRINSDSKSTPENSSDNNIKAEVDPLSEDDEDDNVEENDEYEKSANFIPPRRRIAEKRKYYSEGDELVSNIKKRHQQRLLRKRKVSSEDDETVSASRDVSTLKDDLSLYGELIVIKLRKLDHRSRIIACNKIDNLLFQMELESSNNASNNRSIELNQYIDSSY